MSKLGDVGRISSDKRTTVKFEENKMVYIGNNTRKRTVNMYDVDGVMFKGRQKKCDKAIEIPDIDEIYLIELKGCDLKKAAVQITETIENLGKKIEGSKVNGRIICSRIPKPDIRSTPVVKLERELAKRKGRLVKVSKKLEEDI